MVKAKEKTLSLGKFVTKAQTSSGANSLRRKKVKMAQNREKHVSLIHQVEMKLKLKLVLSPYTQKLQNQYKMTLHT